MKAFWDDLFYDMDECKMEREEFAQKGGAEICDNLTQIENLICTHEPKKALELIKECKQYF